MEKTVNGKSCKWEKLGMVENGNGRKWKTKKVLTTCREFDRIATVGKTYSAINAEKKNGG